MSVEELPFEVQQRLEVIQQLMRYLLSDRYGIVQQQAAQQLGISVRMTSLPKNNEYARLDGKVHD